MLDVDRIGSRFRELLNKIQDFDIGPFRLLENNIGLL